MSTSTNTSIEQAAEALLNADFLLIGAGAGASADSGIAVFSQVSKQPALQSAGLTYDQVASLDSFVKDYDRFCGFWVQSQRAYDGAKPHEGYEILHRLSQRIRARSEDAARASLRQYFDTPASADAVQNTFCVTSNVDGFFVRAGFDPAQVAEIHGSPRNWQCGGTPNQKPYFPSFAKERCCDELFSVPDVVRTAEVDDRMFARPVAEGAWPPKCPKCSDGRLRPNVYLFGDSKNFVASPQITKSGFYSDWCNAAIKAQQQALAEGKRVPRLVILEIGCGLRVPSIRTRCEDLSLRGASVGDGNQTTFIRINPEFPENILREGAKVSISLKMDALQALRAISEQFPQEE